MWRRLPFASRLNNLAPLLRRMARLKLRPGNQTSLSGFLGYSIRNPTLARARAAATRQGHKARAANRIAAPFVHIPNAGARRVSRPWRTAPASWLSSGRLPHFTFAAIHSEYLCSTSPYGTRDTLRTSFTNPTHNACDLDISCRPNWPPPSTRFAGCRRVTCVAGFTCRARGPCLCSH
jgi:hypothetical protein